MSISPDARYVAFVGEKDGETSIWVRALGMSDAAAWPVPDSKGAVAAPFWKPDGEEMAFAVPGELKALDMASRARRRVCPLPMSTDPNIDGAWTPTNEIVFGVSGASTTVTGQLFKVSATGGIATDVTGVPGHDQPLWLFPQCLRDGRLLTFVGLGREPPRLRVGSPGPSSKGGTVVPAWGRYFVASGYLVYGLQDALVAQPVDQATLGVTGSPRIVTSGVQYERLFDLMLPAFSVSQSGVLVYREGSQKLKRFSIVDRKGTPVRDVADPGDYVTFAVSDDGRTIVTARADPDKPGIWKVDVVSGTLSALAPSRTWATDVSLGRPGFVTYSIDLLNREIWEMPIGGGTPAKLPLAGQVFHDRTRDGAWLLVGESTSLRAVNATDPSHPVILVSDGRSVDEARFSPDAHTVAYNSNESGRYEVYVVRNRPTGDKQQVSVGGGVQPSWRADGRELYYLALDGTLMADAIDCPASARCTLDTPRPLFPTGITSPSMQVEDYANTDNGRTFVFLKPVEQTGPLTVVLNWPEIVKKK
jgi:hypothetical protein